MQEMTLYTDGGSRGNPGPGGCGIVITDSAGRQIAAKGSFLGKCTNNAAEYTGLIKGLEELKQLGAEKITIFSDSELMVRQINGQYKVKSPNLKPYYSKCVELLAVFPQWNIKHIYRQQNEKADEMANRAMDAGADVEETSACITKPSKKIRLGVLLSGGGRTMLNIQSQINASKLNAEIAVVISSRSDVKGVERTKQAGLKVEIVHRKSYPDITQFSNALAGILSQAKVDLVVQAGWLCLWHIPQGLTNKVMNIHPALLPSFGGKGMWGHNVHQAVLERGCKISGCTVHFCNNEYDKGPIIIQRSCPVKDDDDANALAARVFEQECIAYPEAIRLYSQEQLKIDGQTIKICGK